MIYSLYEFAWIFLIYGFLGWCVEVIFATVKTGHFINRGFLNGPVCPIYGVGIIGVLTLLAPVQWNIFLLLVGAVLLITFLEFITGLILEKGFNKKWWDYSKNPFNIKGYVCLNMSLLWGFACVFVVYILQPIIIKTLHVLPLDIGKVLIITLLLVFLIDLIVTLVALSKVKQKNNILQDTGDRIKNLSDMIGQNISDNTINAIEMKNKRLQELDSLNKKYQAIMSKRVWGYDRIARAFPELHLMGSKQIEKKSKSKKK